MSWHYSRALVVEFSALNCLDGEPSALSRSNPSPSLFLSSDRMTAFSNLSQSGMTLQPSTDAHGAALSMWLQEVSRARIFPPQEKAQESQENDQASGEKWRGSFAKYDHDSRSWKTHQYSLLGGLTSYSETWPNWGIMRDGACWARTTPAWCITASASGYWPTCTKTNILSRDRVDNGDSHNNQVEWIYEREKAAGRNTVGNLNPEMTELLMGWPIRWTDLRPLETDSLRRWYDWLGTSSAKD